MLSPDIRIIDVDGAHWVNLLALSRRQPPAAPAPATATATVRRAGWLVVFVDGGQVVRALRGGEEIDPAQIAWRPETPLEPLRRTHAVDRVLVIEQGALAALFHEAEAKIDPAQDYVAQLLVILRAFRAQLGNGLYLEPRVLTRFPVPTYEAVQRTFDRLWPDGRTLVLYVIDEATDTVHASLILGKQGGDISLLTTHAGLGAVKIGRGWRREYRDVLAAVREQHGPAHLAVFLGLETWRRIAAGPRGTISRQIALRHVVVDPAPAWLLLLIGGSALAGIAETGATLLGRFLPREWQERARDAAAPFTGLGFDPVELWKTWRARGRAP